MRGDLLQGLLKEQDRQQLRQERRWRLATQARSQALTGMNGTGDLFLA